MLPDGWTAATVADVCDFQNGHGFGPDDWTDHGLPIIRIQNLNGGTKFDYYAGEPEERWLVHPGQMLFAWAGTRGVSFGPCIWSGPTGVLNQHIFKVSARQEVDKDWLFWAMRHITDKIERSAHGFKATLLHVKKSDIERQPIAIPPLGEQRRICSALDAWDASIAASERLLANSLTQQRALSAELLLGIRQIRRFRGPDRRRAAQLGLLPASWTAAKIEEIAVPISQKNQSGKDLPVLSCSKHQGLVDSLSYFKKQVFSKDLTTYKVVPRGAFAYATNHIEEGSIGYQDLYEAALVSPMYTVFKADERVDDDFLYRLLKTERYRQIFEAATNSSVDRRGSLRWNDFKLLRIPLPPMKEQEAICEVLASASQEVQLFSAQIEQLRAERSALMQQLLTGKRRLSVPSAEAA